MKHLIFQVYGALSSWGTHMGQSDRNTQRAPTKSAILGLVAGSLGIERDQDKMHRNLSDTLGFAVGIYDDGTPLTDLHRVDSVRLRKRRDFTLPTRRAEVLFLEDRPTSGATEYGRQTKLTHRDYRCDAYYQVSLWGKDDPPVGLEDINQALQEPVFTPYLGRKGCAPALPFAPEIVDRGTLREVFLAYEKQLPGGLSGPSDRHLQEVWFQEHPRPGYDPRNAQQHRRRDEIESRASWSFRERTEYRVQEEP